MSALDGLPPDQRAVLQLVLQQGRSYEDLAKLLGISADAVRTRAHAGLETLGPDAGDRLSADRRGHISDYLLGQLPLSEREAVRSDLAGSAAGRAWARVVGDQIDPLSRAGVPDIPEPSDDGGDPEPAAPARAEREPESEPEPQPTARAPRVRSSAQPDSKPDKDQSGDKDDAQRERSRLDPSDEKSADVASPGSSRLGGALLLAGLAILGVVLIILLFTGGNDKKKDNRSSGPAPAPASTTGATGATGATGPTGTNAQPKVVAQANLVPVKGATSKALALVQLVVQGQQASFLIGAQGLDPPTTGSYAVWLFNNPKQAKFIAPITAGQIKGGRVTGLARVPQDFTRYKSIVLTRESVSDPKNAPKAPGPVLLQGPIGAPPKAPAKK